MGVRVARIERWQSKTHVQARHAGHLRLGARVQAVRGRSKYKTRKFEERNKKSCVEARHSKQDNSVWRGCQGSKVTSLERWMTECFWNRSSSR